MYVKEVYVKEVYVEKGDEKEEVLDVDPCEDNPTPEVGYSPIVI